MQVTPEFMGEMFKTNDVSIHIWGKQSIRSTCSYRAEHHKQDPTQDQQPLQGETRTLLDCGQSVWVADTLPFKSQVDVSRWFPA